MKASCDVRSIPKSRGEVLLLIMQVQSKRYCVYHNECPEDRYDRVSIYCASLVSHSVLAEDVIDGIMAFEKWYDIGKLTA